ncbi:MAG: hypothetical protein WBG86_22280, partial [Polyangiales bacterium]
FKSDESVFVLCRVPARGVSIPFHVVEHGVTGSALRIGAFLETLSLSLPACANDAILVLLPDPDRQLRRVCEESHVPPTAKTPTAAPFDDGEVRRSVNSMRIDVYRPE